MSVVKRGVKGLVYVILKIFVFVAIFLGLIVSMDSLGLTIYFTLQGASWNFNTFSWVLLGEGFILMIIEASVLLGGEKADLAYVGDWPYIPKMTKARRLNLREKELALVLLVTGAILFFLGLVFFPT